ncbi:phage tail protein I [Paenibacillus macquariensis]|uniref:Phage tail protein, P2 protein I family n=1 Tax=Paenibacillus macquariensis TaxID=948756 RepID=A0ABY1K734_9BACL|nr:phage tail protein I [Paenibacillus macquariensis]MEC0092510.1 phage tail protein I [Paenibacillus macquariensis]OAB35468.1 phage tail protein [Paenibacillus macquariensis subsp. macquariensis]SIR35225.1 phage tail protein, P2 protein I family [Paenibacillus macquariensis]
MIEMKDVSLLDLLPSSVKEDPMVKAHALVLDKELQKNTQSIAQLSRFSRLDEINDQEADSLAWQLHVDFYDPNLTIEVKRNLIKNAISFHRMKGTPAAVEQLVDIVFGDGVVEEWFQYDGTPGHYQVKTGNPQATQSRAQEFYRAIDSVTRFSSKIDRVILEQTDDMNMNFAGVLHFGETMEARMI